MLRCCAAGAAAAVTVMDAEQRFEFDLNGKIVLKHVLNPAVVAQLRASLLEHLAEEDVAGNQTGRVRGNPEGMGASMLHWGADFRALLDHPRVSGVLEDLIGDPTLAKDGLPSFRIDHVYSQRRMSGQEGTALHGGPWARAGNSQMFDFRDGRFYNVLALPPMPLPSEFQPPEHRKDKRH